MKSDVAKILEQLQDELTKNTLGNFVIEIGIVEGNDNNRDGHKADKKMKQKASLSMKNDGITNASLLFIHEHGSPINHIPPRPILAMSLRWAVKSGLIQRTRKKCIENVLHGDWTEKDVKKELDIMAVRIRNYCVNLVKSERKLAPNAPSTIKRKGSDRPLIDTGQLINSIVCRCVKIE